LSEFGLYCPPDRRVRMSGPWERIERLTPITEVIAPAVTKLPPFVRSAVLDTWSEKAHGFDAAPAFERGRKFLLDAVQSLKKAQLDLGFDWPEIDVRAQHLAAASFQARELYLVQMMAKSVGLTLPQGNKQSTDESIFKRCCEARNWRKSIERNYTRKAENKLREIGFIEKGGMLYCSDLAVAWYRGKMRAQEAYLRSRTVTDGAVQLELWDVAQKSLSNKSNRRTELMTRMRGFEDYAKTAGDTATFFTLTCPSAFHARATNQLAIGGAVAVRRSAHNERYEGYSVRDAQAWLSKHWARARARLQKLGITIYGFRVAEPHHDGTPHWHLVLFCAPHHRGILWAVLKSRWLSEYGAEPGALVRRATALAVDSDKGSATGYLSKYIAKNIDGFETGELTSDEDQKTTLQNAALRVTAWASLHGIRQFQQIGGPAIGVYRELRRARNPVELPTIEPARAACDAHEFGRYIEIVGGVDCGRFGRLRPWKTDCDQTTGEIPQNAYGEFRAPQVIGVMSVSEALETRSKTWRILRKAGGRLDDGAHNGAMSECRTAAEGYLKPGTSQFSAPGLSQNSALGPVSITVPGQKGGPSLSDPFGWTNPNETSMYGPN
jgi:hypothetical protein